MKQITIIAFRGTSFRDPKYKTENTLIRAGHVGWIFEDEPDVRRRAAIGTPARGSVGLCASVEICDR